MKYYAYEPFEEKECLIRYRDALIEFAGSFSHYKAKKYYRKLITEILDISHAIDDHYRKIEPLLKDLKISEVTIKEKEIEIEDVSKKPKVHKMKF